MKVKYKRQGLRQKYSNIMVPVFLMLFITVGVLGAVYWFSGTIAHLHNAGNYAGRQTALIQNIKNSVYNIDLYTQELKSSASADNKKKAELVESVRFELTNLNNTKEKLTKAINVFANGGIITIDDSEPVEIKPLQSPKLRTDILKAEEYWQPYLRLIDSFQATLNAGTINSETIRFATDYARIFSDNLYYEFSDIRSRLEAQATEKNRQMQIVMFCGLAIAVLLFVYIVFVALRQLLRTDRELEKARRETSDIMRTVKDGLFLVYPDYRIGDEYSAQLSSIIGQSDIAGKTLHAMLEHIISEKDMETTEEFIDQLFNSKVVEDLIDDLNPLEQIRVHLSDEDGVIEVHYLCFKFSRVYEGRAIVRVLVSVSDVTEAVALEERLEKERRQHDEELEMLASILHIESGLLADFIRHAQKSTDEINNILKISSAQGSAALLDKVDQIFREVHSLKGEASALKLSGYVDLMQNFEQRLRQMRAIHPLTGNDFLPLVVDLDQLIEFNEKINYLNNSLRQKALDIDNEKNKNLSSDPCQFFKQFADEIAARNERVVVTACEGFSNSGLAQEVIDRIKDLSIQLLRNAVVHGIETPEQRKQAGKTPEGHINLALELTNDNQMMLTVQDDGRGIDFEALRQKAVLSEALTQAQADKLNHKDLVKFMMRPGISTMTEANVDAGQGVGSDIIMTHVKALHGKIGVFSEEGKYTSFKIIFPKQ